MKSSVYQSPVRKAAWAMVLMLSFALAIVLAWNYWSAHRFVIRRIILDSDLGVSDEQLLMMLGIEGETWSSLGVDELELRLEAYPVIRKARVLKVFPDALRIFLYRRKPLAITLFGAEEGLLPTVFDNEGYIIRVGDSSDIVSLPILSGPQFGKPRLGARLPESMQPLLLELAELKKNDPRLFALLSELEILPQEDGKYELRLYMNHINIPVKIGRSLTGAKIQQSMLVLDVLSSGVAGEVVEADIRGENVVFRRVEWI